MRCSCAQARYQTLSGGSDRLDCGKTRLVPAMSGYNQHSGSDCVVWLEMLPWPAQHCPTHCDLCSPGEDPSLGGSSQYSSILLSVPVQSPEAVVRLEWDITQILPRYHQILLTTFIMSFKYYQSSDQWSQWENSSQRHLHRWVCLVPREIHFHFLLFYQLY